MFLKGEFMRVILYAASSILSSLWGENLRDMPCKVSVVNDEESLNTSLLKYKKEKTILCMEDKCAKSELIVALKANFKQLSIFVLARHPDYFSGKDILSLGVNGYGNARMLPIHFKDALKCIDRGDIWVYPEFVQTMIKNINIVTPQVNYKDKLSVLSPREKEIAKFICEGYSNKEIAALANIKLRTVKAHTASIYEKLKLKDRVALVLWLKGE